MIQEIEHPHLNLRNFLSHPGKKETLSSEN